MKMKIVLISLFLVGIMIFSGCSLSTGPKVEKLKTPTKLKIGYIQLSHCMALYFADAKGFFKEENIDAELIPYASGSLNENNVWNGTVDVGFSATVAVLQAIENGKDFIYVAPGAFLDKNSQSVQQLVVSKKSGIQVPKDLEGKKIGFNAKNSIAELAFRVWADKNGVDWKKVEVVALPYPQVDSAFEAGTLDAALMPEPYPTLSMATGKVNILDKAGFKAVAEDEMIASYIARKSWIDSNPVLAQAYIRAINKANKYIMEHPEEIPVILPKYNRITPELAKTTTIPVFKDKIRPSEVQVWIDAGLKYGFLKNPQKAENLIMPSILG